MSMTLSQAVQALGGRLIGPDASFDGVTTDSRKIPFGALFVALKGERFDGHDFVLQSLEQGAAAALVDASWVESVAATAQPLIAVDDTRLALGRLAAYWRSQFDIPVAAVTGSNGKTTVKEMLASILRAASGVDAVLATEGNLNNDIGLPLTLLKLGPQHRYAVIEMGMNHLGEIAYLTRLAKPSVALINNAQPAHLEGLGSVDAVARAKGEIFEGLDASGIAAINADDAFASFWKSLAAQYNIKTFGLDNPADVSADYQLEAENSAVMLKTPQGSIAVQLPVPGLHNVRNAIAATTAALAMGVAPQHIAAGLNQFGGVKGRLQRKGGCCGSTVIDDTYNANPASMRAAIQVLAKAPGKKIFVMGDMGELGSDAPRLHTEIGEAARTAGIDRLYALGELTQNAVGAFGAAAQRFDSVETLWEELKGELDADTTVLVKGSRFMRMERVVEKLLQQEASCC
ncbi:UDP-N-acetylmuramoyl-tripeptide--D-alanyl-D-alanine ligase [Novimethylophilus kurashikiensis]|uniref:UDP-N-acetylmuramoyl-tripeptide--D-alanyl-D-alanine ligase n=1 Tax=Novimethylophilus kurashikiensis TaxID=1825523 RepID=A0A2R5FGL6_9PROT|nr:UDP-N-acetylmuramoyl-tripeptide--D-alanyl-D-alanine ligase [Novimethylophilus kurashikiensis]GBG15361.1 UDP-N-acetylmuramoyl-tripeptide--D-alanyl-D-alanine ligase [Novimethylophilus kurashikiensis]